MSMQAILAAGQSISNMQAMQSARTQMQGHANRLRTENKLDGGDNEKTEKKESQADTLEEQSNDLLGNLMEESAEVNEALKPDEDVNTETDAKAEEEKNPNDDTLELSDSAVKQLGDSSQTKLVVGEAVTYKANGSVTPSDPAKSASTFQATA